MDRFLWELMYLFRSKKAKNETKKSEKEQKENKDSDTDTDSKESEPRLSQLIDTAHTQMCRKGHCEWNPDWQGNKCSECGTMKEGRKYCGDCVRYDYATLGDQNFPSNTYCEECRSTKAQSIKHRIEMDAFKASVIRAELLATPSLEMDLLCAMQRRASVDSLLFDINKLRAVTKRSKWVLFALDLDHLKAWNSAMGHVATDKLIKNIGGIMKKYIGYINEGKWSDLYKRAFVYRFVCVCLYTHFVRG